MLVLVKKNTLESQMNQTYGLKGTMLANNHKMELLKQFITFEINMNIVIMLQWKHWGYTTGKTKDSKLASLCQSTHTELPLQLNIHAFLKM